ncbi:MAG: helix-turn-helix domain-containing protein [Lachnospiraceae bacterium]|nr:helix-turn-helix domain-containing protein [Lachnospiraceae bacterium]MBR2275185.1 helix-turn-helix domain-containing protein [Lachnospiraceae bacterium]
MISNQILQSTITGLKEITRVELAVVDAGGDFLCATFDDGQETILQTLSEFVESAAESQEISGFQFFKVYDEQALTYIVVAKGSSEESFTVGKIAAFQIQNLLVAYKERFDKDNFFKNLLLDNLLLVDIYNRSQKLHIAMDVSRIVLVVENAGNKRINLLESVRDLLSYRKGDFVTAVDENNIIVVREVEKGEGYEDVRETAEKIYQLVNGNGDDSLHVAYGTIVNEIREVSRSYKEARMALDVGRIFFGERNIFAYSELGIGRLIYQLPIPLCRMFIKEIFEGRSPDDFDEETIVTINKFFENSLNVSETSRQLFIHRNTLVYRLDKLEKATGLDIRVFEDAITFKIALMVVKYMKYMEEQ